MNLNLDIRNDRYWRRVQAATGLIFAIFVGVHLLNTLLAIGGAELYNDFQALARKVYQHPVVEIALLAFVLPGHLVAGIMRSRIRRRGRASLVSLNLRLHRYAGWFLALVIYGHAFAVRFPSLAFDIWPRFAGVAFTFQWVPQWFYPYYFLLALAGTYHGLNGSRLALSNLKIRQRMLKLSYVYAFTVVAALAIVVNLMAFGGVWFEVGEPMRSDYARLYLEFVQRW